MNKPCTTCDSPMSYMGEWPCLDRSSSLTIRCHRWRCTTCKTYPYEPIDAAQADKLVLRERILANG